MMRRYAFELLAAIALTVAAILASAPGVFAGDAIVVSGFARASATPQATAATAYLTLENRGSAADRLLAVATAAAAMAHLHESRAVDGVMTMPAVDSVDLPAGQTVIMEPGGLHVMLMGLKAPLRRGDRLALELTFASAGTVVAELPIGGVAATAP